MIIAGGRTLLRPIYRRMADMGNTDVFAATTLLVVLGTSVLTQIAGLSLALGAFLVRARPCRFIWGTVFGLQQQAVSPLSPAAAWLALVSLQCIS